MKELKIITKERNILSSQIEIKSLKNINVIHENQRECAKKIRDVFNNKSIINCLVYGMTQTGKTGCMTSLIEYYVLSNNIPIDNIYIITGLSDRDWKKDTKNRMPEIINERVFHRSNLPSTFKNDIKKKKNFLIIIDEIQIACEEKHTIFKTFKECGFYDLNFLLENDVKLVQFSATPDGNINDISDWLDHSEKVKLSPGENHYGPKQAIEQKRVKQFKDLTDKKNVLDLKSDIKSYSNFRYHLIRVPSKRGNKSGLNSQEKVISNFTEIFGENFEYNKEYLKQKKADINDLLENEPSKNTFVFYCEILRCAKTQCKKYIGVSYERFCSNINDSTIVQGSFGRLTGYDDNGDSICYTNISSLENYIKLWDNNMVFDTGIIWNTKTTNFDKKDELTYSSGTFNSAKNIEQLKENCSEKNRVDRGDPEIKIFIGEKGQCEMLNWFKENLKNKMPAGKLGPRKKTKDNDGFYKASIRKGLEILSTNDVEKEKRWGFKDGPCVRSYPCYTDKSDPNTLQWWIIYYE